VSQSVYEQLRERIVSGGLEPGDALPEVSLAESFGISRTPIREALRRLEQDGLVERAARGMRVRRRSPAEILEIYEVRILLEAAAAKAAAQRGTPLDLARLEQLHETMCKVSTDDPAAMASVNKRFHETIWAMSHNETLVDFLTRVDAHLVRYRGTTLTDPDRWATVLREHAALIDAIRDGDAETAEAVATAHMASARATRLLMYAESEDDLR
jgi:DNA-binding GntR family transcriptional regulator